MNKLAMLDRKLLEMLQNDFPLTPDPFYDLAEALETDVDEIGERIQRLKESGIIRRIGAIFDAKKLGYTSTLCACTMLEESIDKFAAVVNDIPYITHNYVRDHELNIWFTLTTPSQEERGIIINELQEQFNIIIICMPAVKTYKIKVVLGMD
jgi:DNA-binding Lrp family transcriptional regulator